MEIVFVRIDSSRGSKLHAEMFSRNGAVRLSGGAGLPTQTQGPRQIGGRQADVAPRPFTGLFWAPRK